METPRNNASQTRSTHEWIEERIFSHDTLKRELRRRCARCGTDRTTYAINPQPCPGRARLWD